MRSYTAAMTAAVAAVDELRSAEHLTAHLTGHVATISVLATAKEYYIGKVICLGLPLRQLRCAFPPLR